MHRGLCGSGGRVGRGGGGRGGRGGGGGGAVRESCAVCFGCCCRGRNGEAVYLCEDVRMLLEHTIVKAFNLVTPTFMNYPCHHAQIVHINHKCRNVTVGSACVAAFLPQWGT